MTNLNQLREYLDELLCSLSDDKLSEIDFDRLTDWLQELKTSLAKACEFESEIEILREDYYNRIAGMAKAVTIVERTAGSAEHVLAYLEDLKTLKAAELIKQYRNTSNKFRIAFPTTFGLPPVSGISTKGLKETKDYK